MALRSLIVDDEPLALRVLENYTAKTTEIELVASCSSADEAQQVISQQDVDLIFLDIRMPGMSGLEFARSLTSGPMIVFVTAFPEHAAEGFELEAVDYLVKPYSFERFQQAVSRALYLMEVERRQKVTEEPTLLIRSDKRVYRLPLKTILYLEAFGDYVRVHTTRTKPLLTKDTLKNLEGQLPTQSFIRIHRSFIIAVNAIQYLEGNQVCINDQMLPVSEPHKKALMDRI